MNENAMDVTEIEGENAFVVVADHGDLAYRKKCHLFCHPRGKQPLAYCKPTNSVAMASDGHEPLGRSSTSSFHRAFSSTLPNHRML